MDLGFDVEGLGGARIYPDEKLYPNEGAEEACFRTMLERLRSRGDIDSAGGFSPIPMDPTTIDYDLP